MSDLSARKNPIITIEPDAKSKKLEETKDKFSSVKSKGRISVGTKPLDKVVQNEYAIREGSSLKKLRISSIIADETKTITEPTSKPQAKVERALKPDTALAPEKKASIDAPLSAKSREEGKFADLPSLSPKPASLKSDAPMTISAPKRIAPAFSRDNTKDKTEDYFDHSKASNQKQSSQKSRKTSIDLDSLPDLSTYRLSTVVGAGLTGVWMMVAVIYAQFYMGLGEMFSQQPHIIGGFLAGILAPVAMLWMIIAHIQRGDDVRQYAIALRDELKTLNFSANNSAPKNSTSTTAQSIDVSQESDVIIKSIHKARVGLRHEIKHLNSVSEKTGVQLEQLNSRLSDRATKLLDMTQEIEKRTASLENVTTSKLADIPTNLGIDHAKMDAILSKTNGISAKMDERVSALNLVLGKMEGTLGNIEGKATSSAEKLSQAVQDSASNVNSLESIISKSIEKLTKASDEAKTSADSLIEKSSSKVLELNKAGEKTSESISSVLGLIDKSRAKIEATSKTMDEQAQNTVKSVEKQAADMAKAQESLSKRIDEMQLQVSEPLAAVNRAVDKAVSKHEEMELSLDKRIEGLNLASDKAVEKTNTIRDGLRAQTQEMSTLMGQIAGHSRSVKTMLQDENDNLADNITSALEKVNTAGDALRNESDKLNGVTANAEERLTKISDALSGQCMKVVKDTGGVISDFKDIEALVSENVKALVEKSVIAKKSMDDVAGELAKSAETVEPIYKKARTQIEETRDSFDNLASGFDVKTNRNIEKLKSFETLFDERVQNLSSSAEDASRILENSSTSLGDRVKDIDDASLSAQEKLQDIDSLFKNHVSDIHLTTDQALLKIDTVQKAMNIHFQDLSASVAESLAQMQDVGAQFVKQTQSVQKLSSGAVEGLDKAGTKANEKVKSLNKLAQTTAEQMEAMLQKVQKEAEQLLSTSSKTLGQMKATGEDFASRARLVEDQMKTSMTSTRKYGEELDKQSDKMSKTSQRSTEDIEKAMAQLASKLLDVKKVSKDTTDEVISSRDKLSSETEHFADLSLKASRVVEEATSSYVRQSGALAVATKEAASHIEKVREGDWRVQRDAFLTSTRFILESLHSLSVDITRMVDGDIQEKVWKAYQKGDIAAFTRRLIENRDKLPLEKMQTKYADDNEFRTYSNRFIRQFEELYEQAGSNDYGELISATFASSDIGGLYDILCDVAGRKSLVKKLGRRVA